MDEYIERGYVLERLKKRIYDPNFWHSGEDWRSGILLSCNVVDETPADDVVEVVRCRDCKYFSKDSDGRRYCDLLYVTMHETDFCSYGKRKDCDGDD